MVKPDDEVISRFNEYVNMTADELEEWLKSPDSEGAGWPKHADEEGGETVGHDSGRKIVEILRANPNKDASEYTEDQIAHMRKVVSYCARHLAQEEKMKDTKTEDELEKTKSTKSLKNWGHDPIKAIHEEKGASSSDDKQEAEKDKGTKDEAKPADKGKGKAKQAESEQESEEESDEDEDDEDKGRNKRPFRKVTQKPPTLKESDLTLDDYDSEDDEDFVANEDDDHDEGGDNDESSESEDDDQEEVAPPPAKRAKRS